MDISNLGKISEMLDEDKFWKIINQSLKNTTNQDEQEAFLIQEISKLTLKEMVGFRLKTDKLLSDSYNSELWCAAYVMRGGCSDDGFEYFRNWLISKGKDMYYGALKNPDNLITTDEQEASYDFEFESFWYVALQAFEQKTGKDLYDYIDDEKFTEREGSYPDIEFNWDEDAPETMKAICPKLYDKFWDSHFE